VKKMRNLGLKEIIVISGGLTPAEIICFSTLAGAAWGSAAGGYCYSMPGLLIGGLTGAGFGFILGNFAAVASVTTPSLANSMSSSFTPVVIGSVAGFASIVAIKCVMY
jgi:hypothetical protein